MIEVCTDWRKLTPLERALDDLRTMSRSRELAYERARALEATHGQLQDALDHGVADAEALTHAYD